MLKFDSYYQLVKGESKTRYDLFIAKGQKNAYNELVFGLYGGIHKDLQTQVEALMRRVKVKSI